MGGIAYILTMLFVIAYSVSGLQQTYPTPFVWVSLPSLWICFFLALFGFYTLLAARAGWISGLFGFVVCVGVLMILVGGVGINYVWYTNSLTIRHQLTNDPVGDATNYYLYAANFL